MPRYIDADSLYRRVKTHTNPYGKPTIDYESGVKVLDMINQEPTADVAPRAEVAKIFEELESVMKIRVRRCVNEDGVITPLRDSCWTIEIGDYAQIKKKYTVGHCDGG